MELYWTLLAWKELNLRIWEISQACLKTYSTEDGMWNHYTTTKSSISLGGCFISRKTTSQVPKSTCPCQTANHQLSLSLWAIQMANVSMFQRLYLIFQTRWFSSTTARITNKYLRALSMPIEKHHIRTQIPWTPKPFLEEYCIYANSGIKKSQAFQNINIYIYTYICSKKLSSSRILNLLQKLQPIEMVASMHSSPFSGNTRKTPRNEIRISNLERVERLVKVTVSVGVCFLFAGQLGGIFEKQYVNDGRFFSEYVHHKHKIWWLWGKVDLEPRVPVVLERKIGIVLLMMTINIVIINYHCVFLTNDVWY